MTDEDIVTFLIVMMLGSFSLSVIKAISKAKKEKQILQLAARNVPVIHISSENNEGGLNDII